MFSLQGCCLINFVKYRTKSLYYDGDILDINQGPRLSKAELSTKNEPKPPREGRLGLFLAFKSVYKKKSNGSPDTVVLRIKKIRCNWILNFKRKFSIQKI